MSWADQVGRLRDAAFRTFNEAVIYSPPIPPGGADVATAGIYNEDATVAGFGTGSSIQSTNPMVDVRRDAILGGPLRGGRIFARGEWFLIDTVEGPTDVGICRLILKRV